MIDELTAIDQEIERIRTSLFCEGDIRHSAALLWVRQRIMKLLKNEELLNDGLHEPESERLPDAPAVGDPAFPVYRRYDGDADDV